MKNHYHKNTADFAKLKIGDKVVAVSGKDEFPGVVHALIPLRKGEESSRAFDQVVIDHQLHRYDIGGSRDHLGGNSRTHYEVWGVHIVYKALKKPRK